jgi:hypothetical protein
MARQFLKVLLRKLIVSFGFAVADLFDKTESLTGI